MKAVFNQWYYVTNLNLTIQNCSTQAPPTGAIILMSIGAFTSKQPGHYQYKQQWTLQESQYTIHMGWSSGYLERLACNREVADSSHDKTTFGMLFPLAGNL